MSSNPGTAPARGGGKPHDGSRTQKIRVYLRHHTKPEFNPEESSCQTDVEKHRVGCGARIIFYRTYPNEKRMPFDGPPVVVDATEVGTGDGGIVAYVLTDNVHFATCPHLAHRRAQPSATSAAGPDFKQAAGGDQ